MKETVTIEVAGATYRLVSDAGEDRLHRLAEIVNRRIDALGTKRNTSPAQRLALVALALVDDLENAREACQQLQHDARQMATSTIARLDRHLDGDAQPGEPAAG